MTAKTVAHKLLIRPGDALSVVGGTPEARALLGPLPEAVTEVEPGRAAVAVTFVASRAELLERFASELPVLGAARAVWFVYPKGGRADVNRDAIIAESGAFGWRPVANVAVDERCGRPCASVRSRRGRRR
ncbi:hypothetical protein O159_11820 [Leifsonia xyli subsp. cynodontis DSM 46306]|uniref:DUF3052 domain-containing protein n=1 Tax=Leifsonia xyli subsp. cynodontis DSM 46306 TaxID=1389489 RepID=U3PCM0_LEIXC|nr:hypothetical protein [Leifsonia xyli]AGW41268.1 hypothetical protein O159_11820 [Leifsonia xyli subsp. cynodontis DSM 46306]